MATYKSAKAQLQNLSISKNTSSYTLLDIYKEVMEDVLLVEELGYDMSKKTYQVEFMYRAKTYGFCQRIGKTQEYKIKINEEYLRVATPEDIHNTIMHEVLHSIDGCMNHGFNWKLAASKVNAEYQFTPISRLGSSAEYRTQVLETKYNWKLKCDKCGASWKYIRRGSTINSCLAGRSTHNKCGGKSFSLEYIGK